MDLARAVYHRDLKIAVMRELDAGGSASEIARKYQVSPTLLWRWRAEWRAKGEASFPGLGRHVEPTPALDDARRIAELERKIGQLTVENDFLKKPCSISGRIIRQPWSVARLFVPRNPRSRERRASGERFVSDDRSEPGWLLPLARTAAGHTGRDGAARRSAKDRARMAGLRLSPDHGGTAA